MGGGSPATPAILATTGSRGREGPPLARGSFTSPTRIEKGIRPLFKPERPTGVVDPLWRGDLARPHGTVGKGGREDGSNAGPNGLATKSGGACKGVDLETNDDL